MAINFNDPASTRGLRSYSGGGSGGLMFGDLNLPSNLTPAEITQIQQAAAGTQLGDYHAAAMNKMLTGIGKLRDAGADNLFNQHFANFIDQFGLTGRNMSKQGMSLATARAASVKSLNDSNEAINNAVATSQSAQKANVTNDPGSQQMIRQAAAGDRVAQQALNERASAQAQLDTQNKQLEDFRGQMETQLFGGKGLSLQQALSSTGGDVGSLNQFLGRQEAETFNTQLKPLIQMALGAQGLSDSGAQVELQSKALAQLEQARQQNMMQAALGGRSQLQGLQRSDLLGGIGYAQQNLGNQFDLQRAGITMQFQQQLESQREQLARELSSRRGGAGGGGIGSLVGMGLGAGLGFGGGPAGMALGAGLGGQLGGALGGTISPGSGGYGAGPALGSSFFAASSYLPNTFGGGTAPSIGSGSTGRNRRIDLGF